MSSKARFYPSTANLVYSSNTETPRDIAEYFNLRSKQYHPSLVRQAFWHAMSGKQFTWEIFERLNRAKGYPDSKVFKKFFADAKTDENSYLITAFNKAAKNLNNESFFVSKNSQHKLALNPSISKHHIRLLSYALKHQDTPEIMFIIAGRLEGSGQYDLAAELWEVLKPHYP